MIRFADMIGQKLASGILRKAIVTDKVAHAYLFTGPEGVGKTRGALAFAAALNCSSPAPDGDACGSCTSCKMTLERHHPDVEIISPDGAQTKIKQMQEMRHMSQYGPVMGRKKVVIVEQADTMNEESSNSVLKTLEEPPDYLIIILISRNPVLLLSTIRSRCLQVRFSAVSVEELASALIERFNTDPEEAAFLAAYSEGRPGAAISLLGNETFFEWRKKVVVLTEDICASDRQRALRLSEEFQDLIVVEKEKKDETGAKRAAAIKAINALILLHRDLLSIAIRGNAAEIINSDIRDTLLGLGPNANRVSTGIKSLLWARRAMEGNANIQILSDAMMMKMLA